MAKWIQEERDRDDDDIEAMANAAYGRQPSKLLPRSLDLLFSGRKEVNIDQQMRRLRNQMQLTQHIDRRASCRERVFNWV